MPTAKEAVTFFLSNQWIWITVYIKIATLFLHELELIRTYVKLAIQVVLLAHFFFVEGPCNVPWRFPRASYITRHACSSDQRDYADVRGAASFSDMKGVALWCCGFVLHTMVTHCARIAGTYWVCSGSLDGTLFYPLWIPERLARLLAHFVKH